MLFILFEYEQLCLLWDAISFFEEGFGLIYLFVWQCSLKVHNMHSYLRFDLLICGWKVQFSSFLSLFLFQCIFPFLLYHFRPLTMTLINTFIWRISTTFVFGKVNWLWFIVSWSFSSGFGTDFSVISDMSCNDIRAIMISFYNNVLIFFISSLKGLNRSSWTAWIIWIKAWSLCWVLSAIFATYLHSVTYFALLIFHEFETYWL